MPTYQYACTECGERLEAVQKFTDDPLTVCAACGGRLRKVYSPVGIVFKGSGFYRTDSRNGASAAAAGEPRTRQRSRLRPSRSGSAQSGLRSAATGSVGEQGRPRKKAEPRPSPRPRARRSPSSGMPGQASIGVIGGSGFYEFLRLRRGGQGRDPVRPAQRPDHRRRGGRPAGGVPAPARPRSPVPAAQDPLPGQPVGAALARRPPGARAERGRLADHAYGRARWSSPTSSWTGPRAASRPTTTRGRRARAVRRPLLPVGPAAGHRGGPGVGLGPGRARARWW